MKGETDSLKDPPGHTTTQKKVVQIFFLEFPKGAFAGVSEEYSDVSDIIVLVQS